MAIFNGVLTVDGGVEYNTGDTTTWASIRGKVTGSSADDSSATQILMIRRDGASNWVDRRRGVFVYNISGLPVGAVITSIRFRLKVAVINFDDFTDSYTLCESIPANNNSLVVGDFDIATKFGGTKFASDVAVSSLSGGVYSDWNFNASGLSYVDTRRGIDNIIKLGILVTRDFDNNEPGGSGDGRTQNSFYMEETGGSEPILEITYVPGTLTKTFTTDGIIVERKTDTFTTDGLLILSQNEVITADGIVFTTDTKSFTADGIVAAGMEHTFTADGIIAVVHYKLSGLVLPRPVLFERDYAYAKQDVTAISGKAGRDLSGLKERFLIGWDYLTETELNSIISIVEENEAVNFKVSDGNLVINETSVMVFIRAIDYEVLGDDLLALTTLELVRVT